GLLHVKHVKNQCVKVLLASPSHSVREAGLLHSREAGSSASPTSSLALRVNLMGSFSTRPSLKSCLILRCTFEGDQLISSANDRSVTAPTASRMWTNKVVASS